MGIVYRDLKPENILVDKYGHIALTDFGLSKAGMDDGEKAYTFCGTPEYVAPEILYQKGHTKVVDYYSLGSLIYEMLSGAPPFYSKDKRLMLKNRLEKPIEMRPWFSINAISLIQGLLTKDVTLCLTSVASISIGRQRGQRSQKPSVLQWNRLGKIGAQNDHTSHDSSGY